MKIAIGSDHRGLDLKQKVIKLVTEAGHEYKDFGAYSEASVDYPNVAEVVGKAVASGKYEFGILICGTGIGMSMAANKVGGVRAAVCHNDFTCEMARRHNDANVLCLGGRVLDDPTIAALVRLFVRTPFEGGRHLRRVKKISDLDRGR